MIDTDDKKIGWAVALLLFSKPVIIFVNEITNIIRPTKLDTVILVGIIGFAVMLAIPAIIKRLNGFDLGFILLIIAVFFAHYLFYVENEEVILKIAKVFLPTVLPYYLLGKSVKKPQVTLDCIRSVAYVSVVCSLLTYIIWYYTEHDKMYDMAYAYSLLPSILFFIFEIFKKRNFKNVLFFILSFIILILAGTRGPIVCAVAFIAYCVIINTKDLRDYISVLAVSFAGFFWVSSGKYQDTLIYLNDYLLSYGIKNRILGRLIGETFIEDKARKLILEKIVDRINAAGIFGLGIGGDRLVVGSYPHNFVYELWCHFGYIIGSLLFVVFCIVLLNAVVTQKDVFHRYLFGIFLCASFIKLFMSSTYLNEPFLWLLLGYSLSILNNKSLIRRSVLI